jgi:sortase A
VSIRTKERGDPAKAAAAEQPEAAVAEEPVGAPKRRRHRAPRPSRTASIVVAVLAVLAGLALWFVFHSLVLTSLQEHGSQARLYALLREDLANATAPVGGAIPSGTPVALLDADEPGMHDLVVVEGTDPQDLMLGPGHQRDTPLPGQQGISVIDGRSVTYGAPFRSLTQLGVGDEIHVTSSQGAFTFRVERLRGPGDPAPIPAEDSANLTLVTSASSGWRSGWAPDHAIFVDAVLTGADPQPAPPDRPTTIESNEQPMAGDASARILGIFWFQQLAIVIVACLWARRRWGPWQTWIVGAPLVIAVLWAAAGTFSRLLPNLI